MIASLINKIKQMIMLRYPNFGAEIAKTNFEVNTTIKTAATDGESVFFNPEFLTKLNEDEQIFVIAHEILHIKFEHIFRLRSKSGEIKDLTLWNIATDAIINANLVKDGFKIMEGFINRPEAINFTSEEFYQILLEEKKESENQSHYSGNENDRKNNNIENKEKNSNVDNHNKEEKENKEQEYNKEQEENDKKIKKNENKKDDEKQEHNKKNDVNNETIKPEKQFPNNLDNKISKQQNSKQKNFEVAKEVFQEKQKFLDSHSLWENAFKKFEQEKNEIEIVSPKMTKHIDEINELNENREERKAIIKEYYENIKNQALFEISAKIELGKICESKPVLDWKDVLKREIDKTEIIWSQRKSIAENNYAYRLEEYEIDDEAETEVMIDVSGSVSLNLVREFLKQLKPLIKESKLKVGCFNERFWGLTEIKQPKDIDNFVIPEGARGRSAWTEDWDLAVRSFSKKREVNKIVFTDGYPCPGNYPKDDLKNINVIWIVYGNINFSPCCGQVIHADPNQICRLHASTLEL